MYQCDEGSPTTFTCMATMGSPKRSPLNIWFTDYDTFTADYDCSDLMWGLMKWESFSVNTRSQFIDTQTYDRVKSLVDEKLPGFDITWFMVWPEQGDSCEYQWKL